MRQNTLRGSTKNIRAHYDLGNNIFQLFLDPSMTYSCALFKGVNILWWISYRHRAFRHANPKQVHKRATFWGSNEQIWHGLWSASIVRKKQSIGNWLWLGKCSNSRCEELQMLLELHYNFKRTVFVSTILIAEPNGVTNFRWACEQVKQADLGANIQVNLADYR